MKIGLLDVSYIIHFENKFFQPSYVKLVRFLLAVLMISQATIVYLNRDALLVADNYNLNKGLKDHELINELANEIIKGNGRSSILIPNVCKNCQNTKDCFEIAPSSFITSCENCKQRINEPPRINIRDSWLTRKQF
jgi:predicted Zn-ribbon and HTH transcriptional regulator